jgi:hypothetical protein
MNRDAARERVSNEADERERHLAGQLDPHRERVRLKAGPLVACGVLPADDLIGRARAFVRNARD